MISFDIYQIIMKSNNKKELNNLYHFLFLCDYSSWFDDDKFLSLSLSSCWTRRPNEKWTDTFFFSFGPHKIHEPRQNIKGHENERRKIEKITKKKNRSVNIYPLPTGQHFRALPIFDNRHRNEWRTTSTITKFILPPLARHTHTNNKRTDLMDSSAETSNNTKEKKRNVRNWICSETRSFASQKVGRSLFEIASVG